jgi:hypothetical protein
MATLSSRCPFSEVFNPRLNSWRARACRALRQFAGERWLGKSGYAAKWSFCLKAASMAAEQEIR